MPTYPSFIEVILPVPLQGTFTYGVPEELLPKIQIGCRVELEFGKKKRYSGLVYKFLNRTDRHDVKPVLSVIDDSPIITPQQLQLWEWMADYYMCSIGEVMAAALPDALRLESETKVFRVLPGDELPANCNDDEYLILEALGIRNELSLDEIQLIVQKENVLKIVKTMMDKSWIQQREQLDEKINTAKISWIRIHPRLQKNQKEFHSLLDQIQKSERQTRSVLSYMQNKKKYGWIKKSELHKISNTDGSVTDALVKKEIYEEILLEKYQLPEQEMHMNPVMLTEEQSAAKENILQKWSGHQTVFLNGITGSGKTMIYLQLIKEMLEQGKQVLYLVPEIALTHYLVHRLREYVGEHLIEYHSELSQSAKVAAWQAALRDNKVFVGARSTIFLPFSRIGLIIVDEEHDPSYKQNEPSPRYHARDTAIILANIVNAKVLLGSATPSVETHHNAITGKYAEVQLNKRYGQSMLPKMEIISLTEAQKFGRIKGYFSSALLNEIQSQFDQQKQVIIFRNRRGYSPLLQCVNCRWEATCTHCDMRMTLHKSLQKLKCHICNMQKPIPSECPQCSQYALRELGFGTEKIEEELHEFFPDKVIRRFDLDIARSRKIQQEILHAFEAGEIHALVGTQMITKGIDFGNVGLVGIIQADQIIHFPDFRAQERAFQLFTQVSGRSGRRDERGLVMIQAYQTDHPVLRDVLNQNDAAFYQRELSERLTFKYPPFVRMVKIEFRHLKLDKVEQAADEMAKGLRKTLGKRVLGPSEPLISKIKGSHIRELTLKLEKTKEAFQLTKQEIYRLSQTIKAQKGFGNLRILYLVDPY